MRVWSLQYYVLKVSQFGQNCEAYILTAEKERSSFPLNIKCAETAVASPSDTGKARRPEPSGAAYFRS